jgi:tetratricopeptide (TPR) repeat protein
VDSVAVARRAGTSDAELAPSLLNLGVLELDAARYDRARRIFREAAGSYERTGNARGAAIAAKNLGLVAFCEGELDEAVALFERSESQLREVGDTSGLLRALLGRARALAPAGDTARASDVLVEGIALAREVGDVVSIADCLEAFAEIARLHGDGHRTAAALGAAAALRDSLGAARAEYLTPWYTRTTDAIRAELEPAEFELEFERGSRLTVDAAAELAH